MLHLFHYRRQEVSFIPTDVLTVRDYRLSLTAQVTARERGTGKVLFEQPVTGSTLIRVGADLASSERQALPLLAAANRDPKRRVLPRASCRRVHTRRRCSGRH